MASIVTACERRRATSWVLAETVAPPVSAVTDRLEDHRDELTAFCRRRLGTFDAEDAVQETLTRALNAADQFQGRGTLRAWLYRIARHVCIDALEGRRRRPLPMDLGPAWEASSDPSTARPDGLRRERRHG